MLVVAGCKDWPLRMRRVLRFGHSCAPGSIDRAIRCRITRDGPRVGRRDVPGNFPRCGSAGRATAALRMSNAARSVGAGARRLLSSAAENY